MDRIKSAIVFLKDYFSQWTVKKTIVSVMVILVLAGAIVVAMDPIKQLEKYRNSSRRNDIILIINALYQYSLDHGGEFPLKIDKKQIEICNNENSCTGLLDLSVLLAGDYLSEIPRDPKIKSENGTGYIISKSENGRITISAPGAENATISVTR